MEIEEFYGKAEKDIRQDFHTKVFLLTLSAFMHIQMRESKSGIQSW